jgi:hypothetical protein
MLASNESKFTGLSQEKKHRAETSTAYCKFKAFEGTPATGRRQGAKNTVGKHKEAGESGLPRNLRINKPISIYR